MVRGQVCVPWEGGLGWGEQRCLREEAGVEAGCPELSETALVEAKTMGNWSLKVPGARQP